MDQIEKLNAKYDILQTALDRLVNPPHSKDLQKAIDVISSLMAQLYDAIEMEILRLQLDETLAKPYRRSRVVKI